MNQLCSSVQSVLNVCMGWPLIIYILGVSALVTVVLSFIQIRYFITAWKYTFLPSESAGSSDMSPLQAFINTLNVSTGNGSLAGMATALYSGGPGAALWIVIITMLLMPIRYAEVFLSTHFAASAPKGTKLGGPMLYLRQIPAGTFFAFLYALACTFFGFVAGSGMQANSISLSLATAWNVPAIATAVALSLFVFYAISGEAHPQ